MEQYREELPRLSLQNLQARLDGVIGVYVTSPQDASHQAWFVQRYDAIEAEFNTSQRKRQLTEEVMKRYGEQLPELVEEKRQRVTTIIQVQQRLKEPGLTGVEKGQLEEMLSGLLREKQDTNPLLERGLYMLTTLPQEALGDICEKAKSYKEDSRQKKERNSERIKQLSAIVKDITQGSGYVGYEDVVKEFVRTDAQLRERYNNVHESDDITTFTEDIPYRLESAARAVLIKLQAGAQRTPEEQEFINTLFSSFQIHASETANAIETLILGENGVINQWINREYHVIEQALQIPEEEERDLDALVQSLPAVPVEVTQSVQQEPATQPTYTKEELEAYAQLEREDQIRLAREEAAKSAQPAVDSWVDPMAAERMRRQTEAENTAVSEFMRDVQGYMHEFIEDNAAVMSIKTLKAKIAQMPGARGNLQRRLEIMAHDMKDTELRNGQPVFDLEKVIELFISSLSIPPSAVRTITDRFWVELERAQAEYWIPKAIMEVGNVMTGGILGTSPADVDIKHLSRIKDAIPRIKDYITALQTNAFTTVQMQRFDSYRTRSKVLSGISMDEVSSTRNMYDLIAYVTRYASNRETSNNFNQEFNTLVKTQVTKLAKELNAAISGQQHKTAQQIARSKAIRQNKG